MSLYLNNIGEFASPPPNPPIPGSSDSAINSPLPGSGVSSPNLDAIISHLAFNRLSPRTEATSPLPGSGISSPQAPSSTLTSPSQNLDLDPTLWFSSIRAVPNHVIAPKNISSPSGSPAVSSLDPLSDYRHSPKHGPRTPDSEVSSSLPGSGISSPTLVSRISPPPASAFAGISTHSPELDLSLSRFVPVTAAPAAPIRLFSKKAIPDLDLGPSAVPYTEEAAMATHTCRIIPIDFVACAIFASSSSSSSLSSGLKVKDS